MKLALIGQDDQVQEVVDLNMNFEVHPSLRWVPCPDDTQSSDYWSEDADGNITFTPNVIETDYVLARGVAYGSPGEQLDMIFHHISNGGTLDANSPWFQHVVNVKSTFPKNDPTEIEIQQNILNTENEANDPGNV